MTRPKPGSKPDRDQLRQRVLAAGGGTADVANEMRARLNIRPREAWRHAHGWTLQEAANRISDTGARRSGGAVSADASLMSKWEKWPAPSGRRPTLTVLLLMADVYGCTVDDLLDLDDRQEMPAGDLRILRMRRQHAPDDSAAREQSLSAPAPAAPTRDPVVEAAEEAARWAQWAEATNVGDIALEQLLADIRVLAADYLSQDPVETFVRTRRLRDRVWALLEGRQHPRQTTELYVGAGYLSGLLAWMSSDLGRLREADTQGRTAWLCAELTGHPDLQAWVLSIRSKIAFWDGRLRDAIAYAQRGASLPATGTVPVLLACQEADAWSQLRADREAQAALARAADARDGLPGQDEVGGLLSCPEPRRANYAAAVLTRLGKPAASLREVDAALRHSTFRAYGTVAQTHISRALAHLMLDSPDGTAEALRPVLDMPPEHRLEPVVQRVHELGSLITHMNAHSTVGAGLCAEITEWCLESAPRRLALSPGTGCG